MLATRTRARKVWGQCAGGAVLSGGSPRSTVIDGFGVTFEHQDVCASLSSARLAFCVWPWWTFSELASARTPAVRVRSM